MPACVSRHDFPPEGIVFVGHLCAVVGAIGFACATQWWWGGVLGALGVALNHTADVLDGTHARATDWWRAARPFC